MKFSFEASSIDELKDIQIFLNSALKPFGDKEDSDEASMPEPEETKPKAKRQRKAKKEPAKDTTTEQVDTPTVVNNVIHNVTPEPICPHVVAEDSSDVLPEQIIIEPKNPDGNLSDPNHLPASEESPEQFEAVETIVEVQPAETNGTPISITMPRELSIFLRDDMIDNPLVRKLAVYLPKIIAENINAVKSMTTKEQIVDHLNKYYAQPDLENYLKNLKK